MKPASSRQLRPDFGIHPHLHALVADGFFVRSGLFYVLPEVSLKPLEELFRAQTPPDSIGQMTRADQSAFAQGYGGPSGKCGSYFVAKAAFAE